MVGQEHKPHWDSKSSAFLLALVLQGLEGNANAFNFQGFALLGIRSRSCLAFYFARLFHAWFNAGLLPVERQVVGAYSKLFRCFLWPSFGVS